MLRKKEKRNLEPINAGSMADIAFLLLIFFLVATQITEDQGILVRLPVWTDETVDLNIPDRNVLSVKINKGNAILVEGQKTPLPLIKDRAKIFISNPEGRVDLARSPQKAVISLQNDRGTSYATYLQVYNELKAAYNELWEAHAQKLFKKPFKDLLLEDKKRVKKDFPLVISEAEPTEY